MFLSYGQQWGGSSEVRVMFLVQQPTHFRSCKLHREDSENLILPVALYGW
jgi:hypothetical protein